MTCKDISALVPEQESPKGSHDGGPGRRCEAEGPSTVPAHQIQVPGTALVGQWLGLRASMAGGMVSIPGRGTKIPWPEKDTDAHCPEHLRQCTGLCPHPPTPEAQGFHGRRHRWHAVDSLTKGKQARPAQLGREVIPARTLR